MFGRRREVQDLKERVELLENALRKLRREVEEIRYHTEVGLSRRDFSMRLPDPFPVNLVVNLLLQHLGIELDEVRASPRQARLIKYEDSGEPT